MQCQQTKIKISLPLMEDKPMLTSIQDMFAFAKHHIIRVKPEAPVALEFKRNKLYEEDEVFPR
jgi:hypothetical protein